MKHTATPRFWAAYDELPAPIKKLADAHFALLKSDPRHPSLHFKKVGSYWSARVGLRFRALAVETDGGFVWFWIGSHADYDRLIK
uniref:Type II toxin-antitoxin system HigB family toxin n=1 Tax=Rhodopseudomonas palustris (strain BisA53) TaxID=316055 RepID=Q07NX2_RHOP5